MCRLRRRLVAGIHRTDGIRETDKEDFSLPAISITPVAASKFCMTSGYYDPTTVQLGYGSAGGLHQRVYNAPGSMLRWAYREAESTARGALYPIDSIPRKDLIVSIISAGVSLVTSNAFK